MMTKAAKFLLVCMSTAFGMCILGLLLGMVYSLYESLAKHRDLWTVLSRSIPYYRILGALGIFGFILFFAFLLSLMGGHRRDSIK
jgi:hypothetical protein